MTGEWQPIETAPKDPVQFLAIYADGGMAVYRGDILILVRERPGLKQPTHWQPLPAPPVTEGERA